MKRKIWPYLLFAIVGGALALWVTLGAQETREQGEAWERFKFEEIKGIAYDSPKLKVRLTPLSLKYGWVEYAESGKEPRTFLAGPAGKDLWFNLSPLWASKVLGDAAHLDAKTFGLDSADKLFTVSLSGDRTLTYTIGGRGFQSSDYFVLDQQKKSVFLWDRQTIGLLESAPERLAVSSLSFFEPESIEKFQLSYQGQTRSLVKEANEWKEGNGVISKRAPLLEWMSKLAKLPVGAFKTFAKAGPEPLFRLDIAGDNIWNLSVTLDATSHVYLLNFGEGKPSMTIDEKIFTPLFDDLRLGNLSPKN